MAFLENRLQLVDLLGAAQLANQKRQQQVVEQQAAEQAKLQAELMKQQLKEQEMKTGLIAGPLSGWTPAQSPYSNFSPGYDVYKQQQDRNLAISQLTGKPLPNMGISGGYSGGGGGGRGGSGGGGGGNTGGSATENSSGGKVEVSSGGLGYIGPDHSAAPTTVEAANNLGKVMAGVREPGPSSIADMLATEQGNQAGMGSLVNQFESKNAPYDIANMETRGKIEDVRGTANIPTPVQDALGKADQSKKDAADLYVAGGDKPPQGMFTDAEMTQLVKKRQDEAAGRKGGGTNTAPIKSDPAFKGLSPEAQKAVDTDPKIKEILKGRGTAEDVILYLIQTYGKK